MPATEGTQNLPKVILQAHMEMVTYSKDPTINLEKDAVELEYDEQTQAYHSKDFKTNIGADDGQGLAALFAIAENKNITHG